MVKKKKIKFIKKELSFKRPGILRRKQVIEELTEEQKMLGATFGQGERTFGTGQNLPVINHTLSTGFGLIKNDDRGETASMFGFVRR